MGRPPDELHELVVQHSPRHSNVRQNLGDADGLRDMLSDKKHSLRDGGVIHQTDVRGRPLNDARWGQHYGARGFRLAPKHQVQLLGGGVADRLCWQYDARQRRLKGQEVRGVIVNSQHGNLLWNSEFELTASPDHFGGQGVVACHYAYRFGQFGQPSCNENVLRETIPWFGVVDHPDSGHNPAGHRLIAEALEAIFGEPPILDTAVP